MKFSLILACLIVASAEALSSPNRPEDIVDIKKVIPNIDLDIRYFSQRNFLGVVVDSYYAPKCFLHKKAAQSLKQAQETLRESGLKVLIHDCYRPQSAVDHFIRWAKDLNDLKMKDIFYPEVKKNDLFSSGYIASRSGHSRGSTIDLSILQQNADLKNITKLSLKDCRKPVPKIAKKLGMLEMGTSYDCFDSLSHTANPKISEEAQDNRKILKEAMEKVGFKNYSKEWWHYSYRNEAYPKTYFNFPVE